MGRPSICIRDESNTKTYKSLVPTADDIVRNCSDAFVLLEDIPWEQMKGLVNEYCALHDLRMRALFLAPAEENARANALTRVGKNASADMMNNIKAPYALRISAFDKRKSPPVVRYAFLSAEEVFKAMVLEGFDCGRDAYHWLRALDIDTQTRIASRLLSDDNIRHMRWAMNLAGFKRVASERVRELLAISNSTESFLGRVATPLLDWIGSSHSHNKRGNKKNNARSPSRPLAVAWFAIWLAERRKILFPVGVANRVNELVPIFWFAFRRAFVCTEEQEYWMLLERQLSLIANPKGLSNDGPPTLRAHKILDSSRVTLDFLRWTSTWRGRDQVSAQFLLEAFDQKADQTGVAARPKSSKLKVHLIPHNVRALWDLAKVDLKSVAPEALRNEDARLRQQKARRRVGAEGGRSWPWVDDPNYRKYRPHERYSREGFVAGPRLLSHVRELRELLPKLVGKHASQWTATLAVWLLFLSTLEDEKVPRNLLEIDRAVHIDSPGHDGRTLCAFMATQDLPENFANRVFYYLERAWKAAYELAPANKRPSLQVCPVLTRFDAPKLKGGNRGQTHRRPLDEEILLLLISENRRDDFAFSRSREVGPRKRRPDWMRVKDSTTGEFGYQWWPGIAVLMDVLLNIPLRKRQARYIDSGEGDERLLDLKSLQLRKNHLASATKGRRESFFRRYETSLMESRPVLGMYVNTNKTGRAYDVPWLPADVAENVKRVIDWQVRFNPIVEPVPDHDYVASDRGYVDDGKRVWPVFRDPSDPSNTPVSDVKLHTYFEHLLEHCERVFNDRTGRDISLFVEEIQDKGLGKGKMIRRPIIDLHSLRVTGITVLIENGVPLEVVRLLVGHATIAMTCYYHVLESRKVHEDLMRALAARTPTIEKLQAMTDTEYRDWSSRFAFNRSKEPALALGLVKSSLKNRTPGWDMKYHGLCAGGDCRYGGCPDKVDGPPTPLWRSEACSLCRFRVTGAPWLVGLVHHVNELWWELRDCTKKVVELQLKYDAAEDAAEPVGSLGGELERAKIRRDYLMEEWACELRYVEQAKTDLEDWEQWLRREDEACASGIEHVPALRSPLGEEGVKVQLSMVHELSHLTELLRGVRIISSAVLPRGIKEDRNALLLDIARAAGLDMPFLRLKRADAERALDAFADLILDSVSDVEALQDLVSGKASLDDLSALRDRIRALLPSPGTQGN